MVKTIKLRDKKKKQNTLVQIIEGVEVRHNKTTVSLFCEANQQLQTIAKPIKYIDIVKKVRELKQLPNRNDCLIDLTNKTSTEKLRYFDKALKTDKAVGKIDSTVEIVKTDNKLSSKLQQSINKMNNNYLNGNKRLIPRDKENKPRPFKTVDTIDYTIMFETALNDLNEAFKPCKNDNISEDNKIIKINDYLNVMLGSLKKTNFDIKGIKINNIDYYNTYYTNDKNCKINALVEKVIKKFLLEKIQNSKTDKTLKHIFNTKNSLSYAYCLYFEKFINKGYDQKTLLEILDNYVNNKLYIEYDLSSIFNNKIRLFYGNIWTENECLIDLKDMSISNQDILLKMSHISEFLEIFTILYHNIQKRYEAENVAIIELNELFKTAKTVHLSKDGITYKHEKNYVSIFRIKSYQERGYKYLKYKNKVYDLTKIEF